jgi:hypothetical protein
MKKTLNILFALAFCAGLCLPAAAQEETDSAVLSSDNPDASTAGEAGDAGAAKEKAAPKKKKAAAKKADQPPSLDDIDPNAAAPAEKAPAKAPAKKPAKKKKKVPPPSEYKFNAVDKTETYKFDRRANPIVKQKKKPAKKAAAPKGEGAQGGKLKPAKSFEDQSVKTGEGQGGE